jgi:hypothetical protein
MSKSDNFENTLLLTIFNANATGVSSILQTFASGVGTLYVALHTGDPGEAGTQGASETAYTNYARKGVQRTTGATGWTVTGNSVSPGADIDFAECGVTPGGPITHFSIGTNVASVMLYSGIVSPNITMAQGVIPRLKTTSTITED